MQSGHDRAEPMEDTSSKRLRQRRIGIAAVAVVALGMGVLATIPSLVIPDMARPVTFSEVWTGDEHGLTPGRLTLTTDDGLDLAAYEVSAENPKAVVVFLSGIHNPSVTAFFGHARMLHDEGYASLLVEMRAHGESDGRMIAFGYEEHRDVQAAVDYIMSQTAYRDTPIVVYGLSMGGSTAIISAGQIPEIDGLVSLSAYSSLERVFVENMGLPEPLASAQRFFVRSYASATYGGDVLHNSPERQIEKLGDRPALIMHSSGDSQVPFANFERILANAPPHVETWVREGDLHFIVDGEDFMDPRRDEEYAERVIGFLDRHFDR